MFQRFLVLILIFSFAFFASCSKEDVPTPINEEGAIVQAQKTDIKADFLYPTFEYVRGESAWEVSYADSSAFVEDCPMAFILTATFVSFGEDTIDHQWMVLESLSEDTTPTLFRYPKYWDKCIMHVQAFMGECLIEPDLSSVGIFVEGEYSIIRSCEPTYTGGPSFCEGYPIGFTLDNTDGLVLDIAVRETDLPVLPNSIISQQ